MPPQGRGALVERLEHVALAPVLHDLGRKGGNRHLLPGQEADRAGAAMAFDHGGPPGKAVGAGLAEDRQVGGVGQEGGDVVRCPQQAQGGQVGGGGRAQIQRAGRGNRQAALGQDRLGRDLVVDGVVGNPASGHLERTVERPDTAVRQELVQKGRVPILSPQGVGIVFLGPDLAAAIAQPEQGQRLPQRAGATLGGQGLDGPGDVIASGLGRFAQILHPRQP